MAQDSFALNIDNTHFNPVPAGGLADYIVRIDNAGNLGSSPTTVSFSIPENTEFEGVDGLDDCAPATGEGPLAVVCEVPALPAYQGLEARVNLRHMVEGTSALAAILDDGTDFSRDTTVQRGADLAVSLIASPTTIQAGNFGEFLATVTNEGPYAATDATLEVTIPTGLSPNIDLPAGCAISGMLISCAVGELEVGESIDFAFSSQATAADLSTATMSALVHDGSPLDPNAGNNTDTADLTIEPGTDVTLSKSRSPLDLLLVGDPVSFTLAPGFVGRAPTQATIVDDVPSNYQITDVVASGGWICDANGQVISCEFTDGPGADYETPIVINAIAAAVGEEIVNQARIDSDDENDGADTNNVAADTRAFIAEPILDLVAEKSGPPRGLVTVGNSYTFGLSTYNGGNVPFSQVLTITDHLPAGMRVTAIAAPSGWICPAVPPEGLVGPQDIVCTTDQYVTAPLGPDQYSQTISLTAEITAEGEISNGMTVSFDNYPNDDANPGNNTTTAGVTSAGSGNWANVGVVKTIVEPASAEVASGDPITFRIEVTNAGPQTALDVRMTDRLSPIVNPNGGAPTDAPVFTANGMECTIPRTGQYARDLQCDIADLPVCTAGDDCPWVEVTVHPGEDGDQTNTAVAYSYATPDNDTDNNVSSVDYTVTPRTDVTVTKTSPSLNSPAAVGQELIYVLTAAVAPTGLSGAENVTLTDTLPNGLRFISATASGGGVCSTLPLVGSITSDTNNQMVCEMGTINNGSQQTVTVVVVPTLPLVGTEITNIVTVTTSTPETDTSNNIAQVAVSIADPVLDLIIGKIDLTDPVEIDADTVYRIRVDNAGPSDATNVVVTDTLPTTGLANPQLLATLPEGWTCQLNNTSETMPGGELVCENPYFPAGARVDIELTMDAVARGRHTNTVSVTSDETIAGYETIAGNNVSREDTTVRVRSDIAVTKTAGTAADPSVPVTTVDLREEFAWKIEVSSLSGPGLDVAEAVTLVDTLPEGMVLTNTPITTTQGSCLGAAGTRSVTCELGDIDVGDTVTVTLWVRILTATEGESLSNTATASTLSFDQNPDNNVGIGAVTTVRAATISGTIWRDFNNDATRQPHDTGLGDITVNLTGVSDYDGATITASTTTNADGSYSFAGLPPGTYSVAYQDPSSPDVLPGRALPGDGPAATSDIAVIENIVLQQETADQVSANHDFTLIPQARFSVEKTASAPVFNSDGSYAIAYSVVVSNQSQEPLENLTVIDNLTGPSRNFGTYTSVTEPANGQYTVTQTPVSAPGYTGQDLADRLVDGGTLAVGGTLSLSYTLRVNPDLPRVQPFAHQNEVSAQALGPWSGQTPADSDTAVATPVFAANIALTKTATADFDGTGAIAVGDRINYTFEIENTGNTPLLDVAMSDDLVGLQGLDISTIPPRLNPGQSTNLAAFYLLTQDDIDRGQIANEASASGVWRTGEGGSVNDTDDAVVSALGQPALTIEKSILSTTLTDPPAAGQRITYQFIVTNTGNTNLRDVVVVDPLLGEVSSLVIGDLLVTDSDTRTRTVTADYTVEQDDIDNAEIVNEALARGISGPSGSPITTDSPTDTTTQPLLQSPGLDLVKQVVPSSVPDEPRAGDVVTWTVTATNTGNVTLTDLALSDPIPGATIVPPPDTSLAPGASVDFTVTAPLTQAHIDAGAVENQATVEFMTPAGPGTPVTSGNAPGGPSEPTTTPLNQRPVIGLVKEMISPIPATVGVSTELRYRFTITNLGNLALTGLDLEDDLPGFVLDGASATLLAATTLAAQDADGSISGTEIVVEGTYPLNQQNIEDGSVTNQAEIEAFPTHGPTTTPVTDLSGTALDNDDPTLTSLTRDPEVRLIKSIGETSFAGLPVAGDTITYAFEIRNTGNVILNDLVIEELLIGAVINNPTNWSGPLDPAASESVAITATYVLTQSDIDTGLVENSARVTAVGLGSDGMLTTVSDVSGGTIADATPTEIVLPTASGLTIVKSYEAQLSAPPQAGDPVTYTFLVTNTGNLTLTDVTITDPLPDLVMPSTVIPTLLPGAANAVELTGSYVLQQSDIQAGQLVNQASGIGDYTDPVTGQPSTEAASSNQVVIPLQQAPAIALIKSASADLADPTLVGEEIRYTFTVRNTGNLELTDVVIDDPLAGITPSQFAIGDLVPGEEITVGPAVYGIVEADIDRGEVANQATATGMYDDGSGPTPVSGLSGPAFDVDEPIVIEVFQPRPSLTIEKTGSFVGGTAYALVGDRIDFTFVIENTGNVEIVGVSPRERSFTFGAVPAEDAISAFDPLSLDLAPGATGTFTASYVLTQADLNAAAGMTDGVSNSAEAVGTFDGGEIVSPTDTATLTLLPQPPSDVTITKTTTRPSIRRGETVPFDIAVVNNSLIDAGLVTITDRMPSGFAFVEGSASVDGAAFAPVVAGNEVIFESLPLGPTGSIDIRLVLRALPATPPGRYTNIAFGRDGLGSPLAPEARANVEILAEAIFDCSDVIGTVFNDLNGNGYQDEDEPGIPGVRLSTARGILVTTDSFGRFSIPCAALPAANIGSNFVLKIDDRTLPTGFALTTDNPAMVRLTPGKMVEVNFGVSLGREIRLTVGDMAFVSGQADITAAMADGIDQLIALLAQERSRLFITLETSAGALARARTNTIVSLIREHWRREGGPYDLDIETTVIER